jgi:drug/metabolite transporter (DMT)-like permease
MDANSAVRAMGPLEWAMLLGLSAIWGGSFFFVGVAVRELPPLTIVWLRVGLAALALNAIAAVRGRRTAGKETAARSPGASRPAHLWAAFAVMGALNNAVPFSLIVWGQTHIAGGLAAILNATAPLFSVLVAHCATRDERITPGRALGVLTGFAGVVWLIGPGALASASGGQGGAVVQGGGVVLAAQCAVLGAALSYALGGAFGRRFAALGVPPLAAATGQVTASAVLLAPAALLAERPWLLPAPGWATWGAVLGLALACTALAYILYFRILATAGATNVLLVTFLVPVSANVLGVLFLDERFGLGHLAGLALLGLGLAAVDGRPLARGRGLVGGALRRKAASAAGRRES